MSYGRGRFSRSPACVYVGNLPGDVESRDIEDIFRKFGRIRDIDIKKGRSTDGTSYAFLEFESVRDAEDAVERRNGYKFLHYRLRVEFTGVRRPRRRTGNMSSGPPKRTDYRVLVTHLPNGCSWQHLKDHMRKAGDVGYANIDMGKGVVEYLKYEDYKYALEHLDGTELAVYDMASIIKVRSDERRDMSPSYGRTRRRSRSYGRYGKGNRRSYSYHRRSYSPSPNEGRDEYSAYGNRRDSRHNSYRSRSGDDSKASRSSYDQKSRSPEAQSDYRSYSREKDVINESPHVEENPSKDEVCIADSTEVPESALE